jgi:hypothetical protein
MHLKFKEILRYAASVFIIEYSLWKVILRSVYENNLKLFDIPGILLNLRSSSAV